MTNNHDSRNLIIAAILSVIVIALWQKFYMQPLQEDVAKWQEQQKAQTIENKNLGIDSQPIAEQEAVEPQALLPRDMVLVPRMGDGGRVKISTQSLHGSLRVKGLRFDDLTLAGYRQTLDPNSAETILFSPYNTSSVFFAEFGWLSGGDINVPNSNTIWQNSNTKITIDTPVTFTWNNKQGVIFNRVITLDKDFMFTIEDKVINNSGKQISLLPFGRVNRAKPDFNEFFISHEGGLAVLDNVLEERTYEDLREDEEFKFENKTGWVGIADKYWLAAMIPDSKLKISGKMQSYEKNGQQRYQVDFQAAPVVISSGETFSHTNRLYAGAKKVNLLDDYQEKYEIPLFERAVDFGWLYFLTRPIFSMLTFFNGIVNDFGLAILLLTVVIKIIMFPLANKSYKSMAKMRMVMPEMQEIREKYKDDPMQMNQKVMEFYKRKKINPVSGCMPILLQIPIFFALYKVLFVTIEMRHADFYGWVNDLSAPDPTSIFNLFGLLQYTPPSWLPMIGAWPLLFMISMYVQQFLNPAPTDPVQKMVIRWMPFMFLFLFASFPAGLVIYWTWNNLLSIVQQWIITRKVESEEA